MEKLRYRTAQEDLLQERRFVRYGEGSQRYNMGLSIFQRLAEEANAVYRIEGLPALVSCEKLDRYLEWLRGQNDMDDRLAS